MIAFTQDKILNLLIVVVTASAVLFSMFVLVDSYVSISPDLSLQQLVPYTTDCCECGGPRWDCIPHYLMRPFVILLVVAAIIFFLREDVKK